MKSEELCFTPATELASMLRSKIISPLELTRAILNRIESVNPKIHAYITVAHEMAIEDARESEKSVMKGEDLGPLHGIPLSIKDNVPTKDIRTTWGSRYFGSYIPEEDALVVKRLKQAGAIILGKTNMPEFTGINSTNKVFGTTLNPWDLSRTAGGSSGGAGAALAAGLGPLAQGGDGGGSVRIPASYCGVVGFRPPPGLIPKYPNRYPSDRWAVLGPMARTVPDTALMLSVMAGPDPLDPLSYPCPNSAFNNAVQGDYKGKRLAWTPDLGGISKVEVEVVEICQTAAKRFEGLGCDVEEGSPDLNDVLEIFYPHRMLWLATLFGDLFGVREGIDNPFFIQSVNQIDKTSITDLALAERKWAGLHYRVQAFFERYDLLLCPTTSTPAFPADQLSPSEIGGKTVNIIDAVMPTNAISLTGLPSISVPAGWTKDGLPVGLQIVGRRFDEISLLRAAANFERIAPWADRHPPV